MVVERDSESFSGLITEGGNLGVILESEIETEESKQRRKHHRNENPIAIFFLSLAMAAQLSLFQQREL